ncbi:MAG TPA: FAD-dependent oxidoreductase [Solirubrobacteraceae bacterium]|nr:FAD-dependent oxidoreductase [Solirubrobacteraceae bacterium]
MSTPRVLVAGGGIAALEAVLALQQAAGGRVAPELLAPGRHFVYRPLAVVEPFADEPAILRMPLAEFGADRGVPVIRDALAAVREGGAVETLGGARLRYDALVVALGARPLEAVPGALTFRGPQDAGRVAGLVRLARERRARRLVFVVPAGTTWPLPLYELVLQTALAVGGAARLALVTPEPFPLAAFGAPAGAAVAALLAERGVDVHLATRGDEVAGGRLLTDRGELPADAVVALARLGGPHLPGLPSDPLGFIPVDEHARVLGLDLVWAAGDVAAAGRKQGGLAAQQAAAAAAAIAALVTGEPLPPPEPPVLRGALVTGTGTLYLRHEHGGASEASDEPLWWPPAKVAAAHLGHYLAGRLAGV